MDYFAGLDISMDETDVCVLDREGVLVCEQDGVDGRGDRRRGGESAKLSSYGFRDGRMAQILFHGLNQLGLPVVCLESRQALPGAQVSGDPQDRPQ